MRKEIDKAVETFHRIALGTGKNGKRLITEKQLASFVTVLTELLVARYRNNWYPSNPSRGSGYRCLRMNGQCIDPTIVESLVRSNIKLSKEQRTMELTIWVDPGIVSIRIGEEGSIGTEEIGVDRRKVSVSDDEAYVSRSPSPVFPPPLNHSPPKDKTVQTTPTVSGYSPKTDKGISQQNISPPSKPSHLGLPYSRPSVCPPTNSQEFMPSGHIPAAQSYSQPKALFPTQDANASNFQGYYKDGVYAVQRAAMSMMSNNMIHQGNYMDIPAQA